MSKYKFEVPNKTYSGVTEGVAFVNGYGETDDANVKNILVNDYGYTLIEEKKAEEPKKTAAPKRSNNSYRKSSAK